MAEELIDEIGSVVVEFFDAGRSRRWSWWDRPAAAALLAAAQDLDRGFDAVVVGEYERAFYGDQFEQVVSVLESVGVQVWLPEAGGAVDLGSPVHQALMVLLGAQAQREVARSRHRVVAAMRAQTRMQGRFLGGRPPYGYRLADGGPHPNAEQARWGRRVHVLEPEPSQARWVRWIFTERARGRSVASLARELNERGVPCPSGADPERNPHRSGARWIVRTVIAILENPRYTGRAVWNRSTTTGYQDREFTAGSRAAAGRLGGRGAGAARPNPASEWEISEKGAHPPLVDDATFLAVQGIRADRASKDGTARRYLLAGLAACGVCGRRMDAHWVHGRPAYRCRHGQTSASHRPEGVPRNVYQREDHLLAALPSLLGIGDQADNEHDRLGLVDVLRERGLQIVCTNDEQHLRPTPTDRAADPLTSSGAPTLW